MRLSLGEAADRAGVEPAFVERLVALDALLPDGEGRLADSDARRISILAALVESGLPLEGVAEAIRRGLVSLRFVDQAGYERFGSFGNETFRQVSERTGVPVELLMVTREAMGGREPAPDDRMRDYELEVVPLLAFQIANGSRPAATERTLRGFGDSLRRLTEVEAEWWRSEIQGPHLAAGRDPGAMGDLTADLASRLDPLSDQTVLALYHGQQANGWMRNIREGVETVMRGAGLLTGPDRSPAICFLDLTGYTRLTDERGDAAAAELAGRLARLVERTSGRHGGRPVKWLGDGVMFVFREPGAAVIAALEMVEGAPAADLPPAHVGVDTGPVLFQEGDYFGRTVNVASRIADYARPGEVLVSQDVVEASDGGAVSFDRIGPVDLKGLSEAVTLHVARRSG
ncbi:MAG TPA: adenylate/guanylate cyclase domain-containing protein [Candidatus Limnocylindrales bacterium]|nr:adenylate/guanylate cyclase domain-containing protein [Candidatus Limnocylindrales bacterium]